MLKSIKPSSKPLRIGIIAGEASGDILGANLIVALKKIHPDIQVEGIAGPLMIKEGCKSLFPMEPFSVTGIIEVLANLREILTIRKKIIHYFKNNPPDIFIGIDAPDANLPIELQLRQAGILTVHYNSPTVWAWRKNRLKAIVKSTHLMLTLFPFEPEIYQTYPISVKYVGHPLADIISEPIEKENARNTLQLPLNKPLVALLPGSRMNEIKYLGPSFLQAAQLMLKQKPNIEFITSFISPKHCEFFLALKEKFAPELVIHTFEFQSQMVMAAADVLLLASGTATLEGLLLRRPMVAAYRLSSITYAIVKRLIKIPYVTLPNILANKPLIPEFIQDKVTPVNLSTAVLNALSSDFDNTTLYQEFNRIHQKLKCNANQQAAQAILALLKEHQDKNTPLLEGSLK
ncbi:MAG: Lipid-A-disaccharide synthase [Legionellaceae bacterium]